MNPVIQLKQTNPVFLVALLLTCFGLLPAVRAVVPLPDGGYPSGNTAEGQNALFSLTTGTFNTAVGFVSLRNNTTGYSNTATGAGLSLPIRPVLKTALSVGARWRLTRPAMKTPRLVSTRSLAIPPAALTAPSVGAH
jgi:hypothetical protein